MTLTEKQQKQLKELQGTLWTIANDLRGSMDANEFKSYILGLIFYRFLSEKIGLHGSGSGRKHARLAEIAKLRILSR